jgi:hypothetical protein
VLLPTPPPTDFFGFFGALKKGDFFWVEAKKVERGQGVARSKVGTNVAAGFSKSFTPRPLRERGRGQWI